MPHVVTWVKDPAEIVFIDQQAPDYQMLVAGVKPGIEVVVLDPNSDGIDQIANFLTAHPDPNLTTVDIVAHGQDGMLSLGNAVLDNATVGQYASQLAQIGAAVQPGGDLMLYGCDVAADCPEFSSGAGHTRHRTQCRRFNRSRRQRRRGRHLGAERDVRRHRRHGAVYRGDARCVPGCAQCR